MAVSRHYCLQHDSCYYKQCHCCKQCLFYTIQNLASAKEQLNRSNLFHWNRVLKQQKLAHQRHSETQSCQLSVPEGTEVTGCATIQTSAQLTGDQGLVACFPLEGQEASMGLGCVLGRLSNKRLNNVIDSFSFRYFKGNSICYLILIN